jgi:hypothetical protein
MTKQFLAQSRERAQGVRYRKTVEYWKASVEEQNREFLARALREENAANDAALALYRDLILYNLENMLADSPEGEKREKLDRAEAALYRKVLEKRLEIDPAGALDMAGKKEVLRVLGDTECAEFAERAASVRRSMELEAVAAAWVAEKKTPEEAEGMARDRFGDDAERRYVMEQYSLGRFSENKTKVSATIANISAGWDGLKENEYDENALPGWITRNEPALAECLRECLRRRGDAGGGDGGIAYPRFLAFLQRFELDGLRKVMEHLRDEEKCFALLLAAGGPEAEGWVLCVRLLGGVARAEDREYIAALRLAWGKGRSREFMERFIGELQREENKGELAVLELVRRVEESFPGSGEINVE